MIVWITDHNNGGGTPPPSAEGAAGALNSAGESGGVSVDSPPPMVDAASARPASSWSPTSALRTRYRDQHSQLQRPHRAAPAIAADRSDRTPTRRDRVQISLRRTGRNPMCLWQWLFPRPPRRWIHRHRKGRSDQRLSVARELYDHIRMFIAATTSSHAPTPPPHTKVVARLSLAKRADDQLVPPEAGVALVAHGTRSSADGSARSRATLAACSSRSKVLTAPASGR
jgi:hypothetical protein